MSVLFQEQLSKKKCKCCSSSLPGRTLDRHIRDETNLVNTVPVSVLQVPDKMSLTVASFNIDLEQFQVFKKSISFTHKVLIISKGLFFLPF